MANIATALPNPAWRRWSYPQSWRGPDQHTKELDDIGRFLKANPDVLKSPPPPPQITLPQVRPVGPNINPYIQDWNPNMGPIVDPNEPQAKYLEASYTPSAHFRMSSGGVTVDPRLQDIIQTAASDFPLRVEPFSGVSPRGTGTTNHPRGRAIDVHIYDQNDNLIPNYVGRAIDINKMRDNPYLQFAAKAREVQQQKYPELNDQFRAGAFFKGGVNPGDLMHFDVSGGLSPETPPQTQEWAALGVPSAGSPMQVASADFPTEPAAAAAPQQASPAAVARMTAVMLAEARGEGPDGLTGVAAVIRNRAAEKGVDVGTLLKTQAGQFAPPMVGGYSAKEFTEAQQIARGVLDGSIPDPTNGATYFANPKTSDPAALRQITAVAQPLTTIGNHTFYGTPEQSAVAAAAPAPDTNALAFADAVRGSPSGAWNKLVTDVTGIAPARSIAAEPPPAAISPAQAYGERDASYSLPQYDIGPTVQRGVRSDSPAEQPTQYTPPKTEDAAPTKDPLEAVNAISSARQNVNMATSQPSVISQGSDFVPAADVSSIDYALGRPDSVNIGPGLTVPQAPPPAVDAAAPAPPPPKQAAPSIATAPPKYVSGEGRLGKLYNAIAAPIRQGSANFWNGPMNAPTLFLPGGGINPSGGARFPWSSDTGLHTTNVQGNKVDLGVYTDNNGNQHTYELG